MKALFGIACWQRPYIVHDKTLVNNTMWCGQWPSRRPAGGWTEGRRSFAHWLSVRCQTSWRCRLIL